MNDTQADNIILRTTGKLVEPTFHVALQPVNLGGKRYPRGTALSLSANDGRTLAAVRFGQIRPVTPKELAQIEEAVAQDPEEGLKGLRIRLCPPAAVEAAKIRATRAKAAEKAEAAEAP